MVLGVVLLFIGFLYTVPRQDPGLAVTNKWDEKEIK